MADCPLCSDILLRHIRSGETYWLCRRCRLELLEQTGQSHDLGNAVLPPLPVERSLTPYEATIPYETTIHPFGKVLPLRETGVKLETGVKTAV